MHKLIAVLFFAFSLVSGASAANAQSRQLVITPDASFPFVGKTCAGMMDSRYHHEFSWQRQDGDKLVGQLVVDNWRQYAEPVEATIQGGRITGTANRPEWERTFEFEITPAGLVGRVKARRASRPISGTLVCS